MASTYTYNFLENLKPADTNEAVLISLAAGEELINCEVIACNLDSGNYLIRVGIGSSGASISDYYIIYDAAVYLGIPLRIKIPGLGNQNKIFVRTNSASNIDFSISGLKKTT